MRFHVPALPGQPITRENSHCAYSQKVRKFAVMMRERGHEVFVYEQSDVEPPPFDPTHPGWSAYNATCAEQIRVQAEAGDILCLIAGRCQEQLAAALPGLPAVEFGVGYGGVFAPFQVFESRAWMAAVYGANGQRERGDVHQADGRYFDAVIPNYFEVEDFPAAEGGEYLLYLGRVTQRKGVGVAVEIAERTGRQLIVAGEADGSVALPSDVDQYGPVGPDERAELLGGAAALLAPTQYLEPFGGVVAEAQLCGTPAITTDWGAFPELVEQGTSGYRCRSLGEFIWAVEHVDELSWVAIRRRAQSLWSLPVVGAQYERYFEHLQLLTGEGWYDAAPIEPRW